MDGEINDDEDEDDKLACVKLRESGSSTSASWRNS